MNTKMLREITDEVVPWEVNQQCNLMNAAGIAKGKVLRV